MEYKYGEEIKLLKRLYKIENKVRIEIGVERLSVEYISKLCEKKSLVRIISNRRNGWTRTGKTYGELIECETNNLR